MSEEKNYGFFNSKPKLTVETLAQAMEVQQKLNRETMAAFSKLADTKFQEMKEKIDEISLSVSTLVETKNIPSEWLKTIENMKEMDPSLPDTSTIYAVLSSYKNLSSNIAKRAQEKTKEKLSIMKKEIVARNIHNCSKCGQPVEEGEYYLFGGKPFCLSHKDEPLSEQQKEATL